MKKIEFLDNLKMVCDERGLKPTPVLKECGISTGSIGRWKAGGVPNADAVAALAAYLHCSTDLLINGEEYHNPGEQPPLTREERELLSMFRILPDAFKEFVFDSIKAAYDKEIMRIENEKRLSG